MTPPSPCALLVGVLFAATTIPAHAQPLEEVPFITSPDKVTLEMLSSAGVKRGDHVIDLGSGDGRIVILQVGDKVPMPLELEALAGIAPGQSGLCLSPVLQVIALVPCFSNTGACGADGRPR